MARLDLYAGLSMALLGVLLPAFGQEPATRTPEIAIEDIRPHPAGPTQQSLLVRITDGGMPVARAQLSLELVGAPDSAYCTCGQATTGDDGTFGIKWNSPDPGALTLRITARADGYGEAVKEFALTAVDADPPPRDSAEIDLWIPSSMLEQARYEGVVITKETYSQGARVFLTSSDPGSVGVDGEAVIHPGQNHAIFSIYPSAPTPDGVGIFASIDGPLISAESRVYSKQSSPSRLELVFPANRTLAGPVTTYVFIVDENGAPAHAETETTVILEAGGALDFPDTIAIPAGNFYSSFTTTVFGDDTLLAHAGGLASASTPIEKTMRNATLHIGLAPDPVGQNSHARYYVWLLADGLPYSPPGVQVGHIYTDNTSVAGFGTAGPENSESDVLYIQDGIASGTLYTRNPGAVSITASLPDMGTATATMIVGPDLDLNGERFSAAACSKLHPPRYEANSLGAWVHPDTTSRHALLSVAPYYQMPADNACLAEIIGTEYEGCTEVPTADQCGSLRRPVEVDGRQVSLSVSPSGVTHDRIVELTQHTTRSFFTEFDLVVHDVGSYVLNATATNVLPASAGFARLSDSQKYGLHITPLIVDADGTEQDVALVSIIDADGALVDAKSVFGRPARVAVTGTDIGDTAVTISQGSARLRAELDSSATITATSPGLGQATAVIPLPRIASHIDLDIPKSVHLHEEFPFAVHTMDSTGTLIGTGQEIELVASGITTDWESRRMRADIAGEITTSVIAGYGAHQESIKVFANKLDIDIRKSEATARVGTPFRIDVIAPGGIKMSVSTGMTWDQVAGTASIDVTSDVPGRFPVTVTASKPGYTPESETVHVTVEDYAQLDISAAGTDGTELELTGVVLGLSTHNSEETRHDIVLPWTREYKDLASAEVAFPHSFGAGGEYVFSSMTVDSRRYEQNTANITVDGDTDIRAVYERSITVDVAGDHDVVGAGHHAYGRTVELVAQPKSKLAFLVVEVFEEWRSLPDGAVIDGNTVRFVADADTDVTAAYRDDYTGALGVAFAAMGSAVFVKYYRQNSRPPLAWTLGGLYRTAWTRLSALRGRAARRPAKRGEGQTRTDAGAPPPG